MRGDVMALSRIEKLDARTTKAQTEIKRAIEKRDLKKARKRQKAAPAKRTCKRVALTDCCLWTSAIRGSPGTDRVQTRLYKARHKGVRLCYVSNVSDVAVVCAPRSEAAKVSFNTLCKLAAGVEIDEKAEQARGGQDAAQNMSLSAPMLILKSDVDCSEVLYEAAATEHNVYVRAARIDETTVFFLCGSRGLPTFTGGAATAAVTPSRLGLDRELVRQLQAAAMYSLGLGEA